MAPNGGERMYSKRLNKKRRHKIGIGSVVYRLQDRPQYKTDRTHDGNVPKANWSSRKPVNYCTPSRTESLEGMCSVTNKLREYEKTLSVITQQNKD